MSDPAPPYGTAYGIKIRTVDRTHMAHWSPGNTRPGEKMVTGVTGVTCVTYLTGMTTGFPDGPMRPAYEGARGVPHVRDDQAQGDPDGYAVLCRRSCHRMSGLIV